MDDYKLFDDVEEILSPNYSSAWEVSGDGTIHYKGHTGFVVESDSLTSQNWLTHILSKSLEKENASPLFFFAYVQALKNAGYSSITIDLSDLHKPIIANK